MAQWLGFGVGLSLQLVFLLFLKSILVYCIMILKQDSFTKLYAFPRTRFK